MDADAIVNVVVEPTEVTVRSPWQARVVDESVTFEPTEKPCAVDVVTVQEYEGVIDTTLVLMGEEPVTAPTVLLDVQEAVP